MRLLILATLPLCAALAPAQHTILLVSTDNTLGIDAPEIDLMRGAEIYEVTPVPGVPYTARPFLPISLQYHYVGDLDNDGQYVEDATDGPGGALDVVFMKANTVGPVTPRDVYWSITSATGLNIPGVLLSDVCRYSAQGVIQKFVTQAMLNDACGFLPASTTLNIDALAQSAAGDLFFSVGITTMINAVSMLDGDLLYIPASAITYDGSGNVTAIAPASAIRIATEADLIAMATASAYVSSVGGTVTTSFELSGLEMDPNGGTWVSPVDALSYPNVLFCWSDFSNDGALISTAGGGTIGVINGVPMGSLIATQGDQLGLLPGTTGVFGPEGIALIPAQAPAFALENYPRNLHTAGVGNTLIQLQTSGGTPNSFTILAWSVESSVPGGTFPALAAPGFIGELGMISGIVIVGLYPNDTLGNAQSELIFLPSPAMAGVNLAAQGLDITNFALSTPSAASFL